MSLFLDTLKGRRSSANGVPIWFMRQVGRYMPAYQKLKQNRDLLDLFHNTDCIVEATLLAPNLLGVDAAIIFADILTLLDGFHIPYHFQQGPLISYTPHTPLSFTNDIEEVFSYLFRAIQLLKQELTVPLIGFSASPFTLACYLLEGGSSRDFSKAMAFMYSFPEEFQTLLDTLSDAIVSYLSLQARNGIDTIQLFDSSTYRLPSHLYDLYVVQTNRKVIQKLSALQLPIILFCRHSSFYQKSLETCGATALSMDWHTSMKEILQSGSKDIIYQGNLDPALLLLPREKMLKLLSQYLAPLKEVPNFILNTGHGLLPNTPMENVLAVIDYVRSEL